jgi:TetR/AcrR family transcriptional repressor of nem operon
MSGQTTSRRRICKPRIARGSLRNRPPFPPPDECFSDGKIIVDRLYNYIIVGFVAGESRRQKIMGRTSDAKKKLLSVAFDLIHENSYGAVGIEQICQRAKVNKGSFYYFFKTKTDLVVAAYEEHWRLKEPDYERIFSAQNPPLKRLELWCDYIRSVQKQRHKKYGQVCGCPYTSVGGELATQDKKIRLKTRDLIDRHVKYLAGAMNDAIKSGVAEPADPEIKAQLVHAFVVGLLLRAKIYNDLKILRHLNAAIFSLIGAKHPKTKFI